MAGLYIHIPFCRQACHYCDFHFSTQQDSRQAIIEAIARELKLQNNYLGHAPLDTIYFGGGTPSLLTAQELQTIFDAIHTGFKTSDRPEITLEANPDDLTPEKLSVLQQAGINRLSIGIQSFDDDILKFINRAHDVKAAVQSIAHARNVGFDNISIDLMYAIPGLSTKAWEENIRKALTFSPEHLSAYSLTLEEKTVFGRWERSGKLPAVPEELAAEQFELLMARLEEGGYEHYEVSNFCRPGLYSRHNSSYWKQQKYLGIGPSAHSFNGVSRQFNIANNLQYLQRIQQDQVPFTLEVLSTENKINEYILTTLRTNWGSDLKKIKNDFQHDLWMQNQEYLASLLDKKLITLENDVLMLTRTGKLFADKIASDLFVNPPSDS